MVSFYINANQTVENALFRNGHNLSKKNLDSDSEVSRVNRILRFTR